MPRPDGRGSVSSLNRTLRDLPSVDEVVQLLDSRCPRELLTSETRRIIDQARDRLRRGEQVDVASIPPMVLEVLRGLERPSFRG